MKWKAPSERAQFWIAAPITIPACLVAAPFILLAVGVGYLSLKMFPNPSHEWHRWFAWRPVRLGHWSRSEGWAWFETVERRARPYNWPTEYRSIP